MSLIEAETAVVGSGPVALAHALFAAVAAPVILCGRWAQGPVRGSGGAGAPGPPAGHVHAVERVPAGLLTLLLEVGVTPAELDVDRLTTTHVAAWDDGPVERTGPACAHLDRAALDEALWQRVATCTGISVTGHGPWPGLPPPGSRFAGPGWASSRLVDATGRRALTARRHLRPARPWVATCCTVARAALDPTMMLAAGPGGYAYRLGSARWLTIAWVGPGSPPRDVAAFRNRLSKEGTDWLLDGMELEGGRWSHRVASLDIPVGADRPGLTVIGDAAVARDALASQGTSIGLSDARLATRSSGSVAHRHRDGLHRHLRSLGALLDTNRHQEHPNWSSYRRWLDQLETIDPAAPPGAPVTGWTPSASPGPVPGSRAPA